jgi:Tol biopolymer transport system component
VLAVSALAVAALFAVDLGYVVRPGDEGSDPPARLVDPVRLTRAIGVEDFPAWSPDGQMIAYQSDEGGNLDVWVAPLDGGRPVNLTADHQGWDRAPTWSPDGRQIAFLSERDPSGVFVMPSWGGVPSRAVMGVERLDGPPQWSPDGSALAYLRVIDDGVPVIEIQPLPTGDSRRLRLPGLLLTVYVDLRISPDGRFFTYVEGGHDSSTNRVWVVRIGDAKAFPVTDGTTKDHSPSWSSDARTLYYVSDRDGISDLWLQPFNDSDLPEGPPRRQSTGTLMVDGVFSPDRSRFVYSIGRVFSNVWRVPILGDRPATWADAEQLTFDDAFVEQLDVSADGERLIFSSDRGGNPDLWMLPSDGGEMQHVTTDLGPDWGPRWSPGGDVLAFSTTRSGNRDIWQMPVAGSLSSQLTRHPGVERFPSWSPDGREIAFVSDRSGNDDVWATSVSGGGRRQMTDDPAADSHPAWSPDGQWLVFVSHRSGNPELWRMPAGGGDADRLLKGNGGVPRWAPDSREIYFLGVRDGRSNVWAVSLADGADGADGAARRVTDLVGKRGGMGPAALATDGRYAYFTWQLDQRDLWVADVAQNEGDRD